MAIARAIVSDPTLLVCDEPTGDLDRATADEILTLLQMLNREHGKTVVMVTHDPKAAEYARRQLHLDKGTLANGWEAAMKYLPLLWAGLFRKKTRTVLTLLSVCVAFLLFGLLQAVTGGLRVGRRQRRRQAPAHHRALLDHRALPISYLRRIEQVPGVVGVAYAPTGSAPSTRTRATPSRCSRWIPSAISTCTPSSPSPTSARRSSRRAPAPSPASAWSSVRLEDRAEAADQLGDPPEGRWQHELGVRPGGHPRRRRPGGAWQHRHGADQRRVLRRGAPVGKGRTGWYIVRIADPAQARAISAAIDALFMNSPDETKTQPEKEFAIGFAKQIGDIGALVTRILVAVFFTILI